MKLFLRTPAGNLRDEGRRNYLVQLQKKKIIKYLTDR